MIESHATAKYVRTSAQKAGLVLDLVRGKDVNRALAALAYARKGIALDIAKVLRSAIANAQQKDGFGGDVDRLYVKACYANQGPSMKRVRPAPMGRAYRVVKRSAHLTVQVAERPADIEIVAAAPAAAAKPRRPAASRKTKAGKAPAKAKGRATRAKASTSGSRKKASVARAKARSKSAKKS
jgi:large subunit ribosomal protein L22